VKIIVRGVLPHSSLVPERIGEHPLVANRDFYTLPDRLLEALRLAGVTEKMSTELHSMELALSQRVGDHSQYAGFRSGTLIPYNLLEDPKPLLVSPELAHRLNWPNPDNIQETIAEAERRSESFSLPGRSYIGWLLTNRYFVREHDELFAAHREDIRSQGIPRPLLAQLGRSELSPAPDPTGFVNAFRGFCQRWRIQSLTGPYLPLPAAVLAPSLLPQHQLEGTLTIQIPDVVSIAGEGPLRDAVNDARDSSLPPYLDGWKAIVASSNSAKNVFPRYVRLFRLQHFRRVLFSRHAASLRRTKMKLISAFSSYFDVSVNTLRRDWDLLDLEFGPQWESRPNALVD
jgi:hypothetical protein